MSVWPLVWISLLVIVIPRLVAGPASAAARGLEIRGMLRFLDFANAWYCRLWHGFELREWAPLPVQGAAILISNHTCGIDHMLLQASCRRLLGFMVAREYYEHRLLYWICRHIGCIPVDRDGRDFAATRAALRALADGRVVPIFPEGKIIPESGRVLGEMKPGAAYLALRARVPVYPAFIWGTPNTNEIFHSLARHSRARVIYGPPIELSDLESAGAGKKETQAEVCRRFRAALTSLQSRAFATDRG